MKRKALLRITALITALAISFSAMAFAQEDTTLDYGEKLDVLVDILKTYHLDMDPSEDPIRRGLIKMFTDYPGTFDTFVNIMYQSYDEYSYYMSAESYDQAFPNATVTAGIGVTLSEGDDGCYISSVSNDSPAMAAGLAVDDKILAIDGKSVANYTTSMIGDLIRGPEGEDVTVTVLRDDQEISFTITRAPIAQPNVTYSDIGEGVAYIKISRMAGTTTFLQFCEAYDNLAEKGIKSVIFDLRDNPGGDLNCMINIMDRIIPDKDMPYLLIRQTNPLRIDTCVSEGYGWEFNKHIVLINENTASAAEIMAGALQNLGYAEVVGVTSKGKGLGQSHLKLNDGSYAIVSSHEMILPFIGTYTGKGISPNHRIELKTERYVVPALAPLDFTRGVYQAMNKNTLGIEQRLKHLGFFDDTPDKVSDFKTFHAVNQFQKAYALEQTQGYCDAATVVKIDNALKEYAKTAVTVTDTQLPKAIALAKSAAKSNIKRQRILPHQVRFVSEK